jgi:hypothetical protein
VEIRATDGESVSLAVVSYQFPGETSEYWDSNWLVIAGAIRASHRRWKFRDACLTAGEARGISTWLRSAAANEIEPSTLDPELGWSPSLVFVEPNLAFSVAPVDGLVIRVHFSLESAPPEFTFEQRAEIWQFFVDLPVTSSTLLSAAHEWDDELRSFPVRRTS